VRRLVLASVGRSDPGLTLPSVPFRLYNISTITGIVAWAIILMTYLRFYYGMRHQGLSRDELPYKAPFQPYASWIALVFISLVALFNGFHVFIGDNFTASDFIAAYIGLIGVFIFWAGWKCFGGKRTRRGQIFAFTKCVLSACQLNDKAHADSCWPASFSRRHVTLDDMDFVSGRREFDELDEAEAIKEANRGPRSPWQRFVDVIF
jgi:amino acid permease